MYLDILAFPWRLYSPYHELIAQGDGSLFKLAFGAETPADIRFMAKIENSGWYEGPSGHQIYARRVDLALPDGALSGVLVLPGVRVKGGKRSNDRPNGPAAVFTRDYIEKHVGDALAELSRLTSGLDELARQNLHEIRGINAGIYHSALELKELSASKHWGKHPTSRISNILALSQILSSRMEFLNFLNEDSYAQTDMGIVAVFPKFDKMTRCFMDQASQEGRPFYLEGISHGTTFGPKRLMDLIAYLMLENAFKYTPQDLPIRVSVNDRSDQIEARVSSFGPIIEPHEKETIFQRGVRGTAARKSGISGTGVGLYGLQRLVTDGFAGRVTVDCGEFFRSVNGVPYHEVEFAAWLPYSI